MNDTTFLIVHSGLRGMKWGIRRFQNPDGSLTPAGKERYRLSKEQKDGMIRSGDIKKVSKHRDDFNDDEIKKAIDRFDLYQSLDDRLNKKAQSGKIKLEDLVSVSKNLSDLSKNISSLYDLSNKRIENKEKKMDLEKKEKEFKKLKNKDEKKNNKKGKNK